MSVLFGRAETRDIGRDDLPWGSVDSGSGLGTGMQGALRLIPVYAAVSLIADSIATLPLHAYQDAGDNVRKRLPEQPRIVTAPQLHGTRVDWVHQAMASLLLRGNAYGLTVSSSRAGWPERVVWLHPDKVRVDESGSSPRYFHNGRPLDAALVTHIAAFTVPESVVGISPVGLFRLQLSKGMAAQRWAADYFDRGVAPVGVLKHKNRTLTPDDRQIAKDRFKAAVQGRDIFVTGQDWEWESLSLSATDVAFLEAIQATATEIAAIYRVTPEDLGGKTGHSRQYATLVMEMLKFGQRALLPWTARLEAGINPLLPPGQYVKFNLDAVARADQKTRMETHRIGLETGMETLEEARALEEKLPLTPDQIAQWQERFPYRRSSSTDSGSDPAPATQED